MKNFRINYSHQYKNNTKISQSICYVEAKTSESAKQKFFQNPPREDFYVNHEILCIVQTY